MGLDVYLYQGKKKIELPSTKYPEHLFKIGYFRSSYNGGGYNAVMRQAGLSNIDSLFAHQDEGYEVVPDWPVSLARIERELERMDAYAASPTGAYAVMTVTYNMFIGPAEAVSTEKQALDIFSRELERDTNRDQERDGLMSRAYSNRDGEFHFGNGLKVHGFVSGVQYRQPCTYVIYHAPDRWTWYRQALEIMGETCQYILATGKPQKYCLHWSG